MKRFILLVLVVSMLLSVAAVSAQDTVTLVMGSWRTEDIEQWANIIAAFEAEYPEINIEFEPTLNTEYNSVIQTFIEAGEGPDLITCRPFDVALNWYKAGGLANISDLPGLENFTDVAKGAWAIDDGSEIYCVPMATVIHGFIYNKDIFDELELEEPRTESEFFAVLDAVAEAGYTPIAMGTKDDWAITTMGFNNLWPNFCNGEDTRLAVLAGEAKHTDQCFVDAFASVQRWAEYMPDSFQSIGYADTQQLFASLGMSAVYPSGSWEIPLFNSLADFEMGAFRPYQPDDRDPEDCWIDDHVDIAIGMNSNTDHPEEARVFLEWMTTQEFAQAFFDNQPGFFPLGLHELTPSEDPLAAAFLSWRSECGSTIRLWDQFLRRNAELDTYGVARENFPSLMNGDITPEEIAAKLQEALESWYVPMGQ